jgi:hypothetical protein
MCTPISLTRVTLVTALYFGGNLYGGPVTIYNSFLPGNTYHCCSTGGRVAGSTATITGVGGIGLQMAGAFTPAGNFGLSQIDVAFDFPFFRNPPDNNTNGFNLSLNQDSSGAPGALIEAWTGLIAPSQSVATSSVVQTVFPVFGVPLSSGKQYWVVASPAVSNTFVVWDFNATDGTGVGGRDGENSGAGWAIADTSNSIGSLAFDVQGTVPEPNTLLMLGIGLLGIGCCLKRRHSVLP